MGYKSLLKKFRKDKKRQTKTLREVIGTDLLTWKEKFIQNEVSGLYSLTNEDAYFKCPGEPSSLSLSEFERKLKEIDKMFTVVPCDTITPKHQLQGHSIYYNVPAYGGYIKVCNVGKNMDYNIPADSQGKVVEYEGDSYKYSGKLDEVPLLYRGWVAALECCKTAYAKWENEGISPAMVLNPKEVLKLRQAFSMVGFKQNFETAKQAHIEMLENDNTIINAANANAATEATEQYIEIQELSEDESLEEAMDNTATEE